VEVGERVGSYWVITGGLKATERVVIQGLQKARPGHALHPQPGTLPPFDGR
jgi:membrane fusion protein, multidrug efflux system